MAEPKKYKIGGKWLTKGDDGNWQETTPPVESDEAFKAATEPVRAAAPTLDTATKVARTLRDFEVPQLPGIMPGLDLITAVKNLATGGKPGLNRLPLNLGETRSTLTGVGGALGTAAAGTLGLPSGPGAVATGAAGYAGGSALGSAVGQFLESQFPNLFQRGYAPEQDPNVRPTEPSLGGTVSDVAINAAGDLLTGGIAKVGNLAVSKPAREQLIESMMTGKYKNFYSSKAVPNRDKIVRPPLTLEEVDALNKTPNVPTTTGQVLDENSPFNAMQRVIAPERTARAIEGQMKALDQDVTNFRATLDGPAKSVTPTEIGKRGVAVAQNLEQQMIKEESDAYNAVANMGKKFIRKTKKVTPPYPDAPPVVDQLTGKIKPPKGKEKIIEDEILGPIKLTRSEAANAVEGEALDKLIKEIKDPQINASLRLVREKMQSFGDGVIRPYEAVRQSEKLLNEIIYDRKLPESAKNGLLEVRANLVSDIEKNLQGQVKETAGFWDSKAAKAYEEAKNKTTLRHDRFNAGIQDRMEAAVGEVAKRPGERGGSYEEMFKTIMDSPQEAKRLAEVGGYDNARDEFVRRVFTDNRFYNPETKRIDGVKALAFFESDQVKGIAGELLNKEQRQNIRRLLLRAKEMDPAMSKVGQLMVDMGAANTAINAPAAAVTAITRGNVSPLLRGASFISFYLGSDRFARNYLLNDQFARRIANAMGKDAKRPGGAMEVAKILGTLQGVKLLAKADNGQEFMYDSDSKTLEPIPPTASK